MSRLMIAMLAILLVSAVPASAARYVYGYGPYGYGKYLVDNQGYAIGKPDWAKKKSKKKKYYKKKYKNYGSDPIEKKLAQKEREPIWDGGPRPKISPKKPPVVKFYSKYKPGNIVIDTKGRQLFYVLSASRAYRYPITVGKKGFTWTGTKKITRVKSWPDWRPPKEMIKRKPNLPDLMTGGVYNPLGAKALYLGSSLYRIHGTSNPKSIGQASSSGCFRMYNAHVEHLSRIVKVGKTRVFVRKSLPKQSYAALY